MNIGGGRRPIANVVQKRVNDGIVSSVMNTFRTRPMPMGCITERECQHRLDCAVEIWNHLYGELGWSVDRALDTVELLLTKCIDGATMENVLPMEKASREGHTMWAPELLSKIEPERRLSALATIGNNGGSHVGPGEDE